MPQTKTMANITAHKGHKIAATALALRSLFLALRAASAMSTSEVANCEPLPGQQRLAMDATSAAAYMCQSISSIFISLLWQIPSPQALYTAAHNTPQSVATTATALQDDLAATSATGPIIAVATHTDNAREDTSRFFKSHTSFTCI